VLRFLRDFSIRGKLMFIIMATVSATFLLGGGVLVARYATAAWATEAARLTTLGKAVSSNIAAAVSFDEPASAEETLAAFAVDSSILATHVYTAAGEPFARYAAPGSTSRPPPTVLAVPPVGTDLVWSSSGDLLRDDVMYVSGPILLDGDRIGTIHIDADLRPIRTAFWVDVGLLGLIFLMAGMVAMILSSILQEIVSEPITRLAQATRDITRTGNYKVSVEKVGNDEVGSLIDGFNEMLRQISIRDEQLETRKSQLEDAHRIARLGNWEWRPDSDRLTLSPAAARIVGIGQASFEGTLATFLALVHPHDRDRVGRSMMAATKLESPFNLEHRVIFADDQFRHVQLRGELKDTGAEPGRLLVGSIQNVTDRVLAEEQIRVAANAMESTSDAIMITDKELKIVSVNRAFTSMSGYAKDEAVGRTPQFLMSKQQEPDLLASVLAQVADAGHWQGEILGCRRDGEDFPQRMGVGQVVDGTGEVSHYVFVSSDISQYKQYEASLEHLARHDVLTGLPNRGRFREQLGEAIARADRRHEQIGVLFIDLDHFKSVNDSLGHAVGDQLLIEAASRIRDCLRNSDIVARQGGDEFTVLLDNINSRNDAGQVAEKIVEQIARPFHLAEKDLIVGASIGIACYPEDGMNEATLLKNADLAMYEAKMLGRNRCRHVPSADSKAASGSPGVNP
jgi:diguanylate cyclase (GGDEF)-like protein/PAS domain S-box-containing protein